MMTGHGSDRFLNKVWVPRGSFWNRGPRVNSSKKEKEKMVIQKKIKME